MGQSLPWHALSAAGRLAICLLRSESFLILVFPAFAFLDPRAGFTSCRNRAVVQGIEIIHVTAGSPRHVRSSQHAGELMKAEGR